MSLTNNKRLVGEDYGYGYQPTVSFIDSRVRWSDEHSSLSDETSQKCTSSDANHHQQQDLLSSVITPSSHYSMQPPSYAGTSTRACTSK